MEKSAIHVHPKFEEGKFYLYKYETGDDRSRSGLTPKKKQYVVRCAEDSPATQCTFRGVIILPAKENGYSPEFDFGWEGYEFYKPCFEEVTLSVRKKQLPKF